MFPKTAGVFATIAAEASRRFTFAPSSTPRHVDFHVELSPRGCCNLLQVLAPRCSNSRGKAFQLVFQPSELVRTSFNLLQLKPRPHDAHAHENRESPRTLTPRALAPSSRAPDTTPGAHAPRRLAAGHLRPGSARDAARLRAGSGVTECSSAQPTPEAARRPRSGPARAQHAQSPAAQVRRTHAQGNTVRRSRPGARRRQPGHAMPQPRRGIHRPQVEGRARGDCSEQSQART